MRPFPIKSLVCDVQELIVGTFDVSKQEALTYAAEIVALAEGWESQGTALNSDLSYRINKDLGEIKTLK